MTDEADSARLVAQALRAQAAQTPIPSRGASTNDGSAARAASGAASASAAVSRARSGRRGPAVGWLLLIAVLLGAAAGVSVGLATLV